MTTTPTSGAAIQRYKIGYHADEWGQRSSTPSGIQDASGSWVRYADHVTALAAGQATAAPAGDWLWVKLMDFCKKRGFAPANFNDLFEIVDAARAARAPADSVQEDALSDSVRTPLDSLHADAAYLIGRLREGSMPYARVIEIIRERIDAAKAAIRASAAHGQAPAGATLPDGWVPLTITHEGQYPEEVAYGPQIMMDRLDKWLGKYFAQAAQADSQPAPVLDERDDFEKAFPLPSGCVRVGTGYAATGYSNWAAHTHCERWQGWQARAARDPADSVLEDAARLDWLLLRISGAEFRRLGVHYSGNARRAAVDAARKQGANHD